MGKDPNQKAGKPMNVPPNPTPVRQPEWPSKKEGQKSGGGRDNNPPRKK